MSLLNEPQYVVKSTKYFVEKMTYLCGKLPNDHFLVSSDVKLLITIILLDKTIEILLNRIYDKNEASTDITNSEIKHKMCSLYIRG